MEGAPRFMVLYCSIMILLLAFFIALQSFAKEPEEGLFHSGRGSFVRALESFGIGPFIERRKRSGRQGAEGVRYTSKEGQQTPPDHRRIDPENDAARRAMMELQRRADVRAPETPGWNTIFVTPFEFGPHKQTLTEQEQAIVQRFAGHISLLIVRRGCVISVGASYVCADQDELGAARNALCVVAMIRETVLAHIPEHLRETARPRLYTFCQRKFPEGESAEEAVGELKLDVLVTGVSE